MWSEPVSMNSLSIQRATFWQSRSTFNMPRSKRRVNSWADRRLDCMSWLKTRWKKKKKATLTDRAGWCQDQGAPGIMIQSAWAVRDKRWHLSTSALPAVHHQCNMLSVIMAVGSGCWVTAIKPSDLVFRNSLNHKIQWIIICLCYFTVIYSPLNVYAGVNNFCISCLSSVAFTPQNLNIVAAI